MEKLFKLFPQWVVVLLLLGCGIILFYVVAPPHTVCDSQIEIFQSSQTPFLYLDAKKTYLKTSGYEKSTTTCKLGNSHGACREMVDGLRKMLLDIKTVPSECYEKLSDISEVKSAIWNSLTLFSQIAWGEKPPPSAYEKVGWFDAFHLHTFCSLKRVAIELYTEEKWNEFASVTLEKLPQANQLERNDAWGRSLMSLNCAQYR
jgi:hypothetical protein